MTSDVQALTVAEMREADRRAIEDYGIPGVVLMENAGRGAAGVALQMLLTADARSVLVLAGRGNNGGNGYVIARHLHNAGVEVLVRVLASLDDITGDARINLDVIRRMGLDVREVKLPDHRDALTAELNAAGLVVDAMLGTGTKGDVRDPFRTAIELANAAGRPVLAVDIPSGLDGDTGPGMGGAVVARRTATFAAPKVGLVTPDARPFVGQLTVIDIGIPHEIIAAVSASS